jgi:hypothetical protein
MLKVRFSACSLPPSTTPQECKTGNWSGISILAFPAYYTSRGPAVNDILRGEKVEKGEKVSGTIIRPIINWVAVGTAIADRPPRRSVRAALPHTAPTSDNGVK